MKNIGFDLKREQDEQDNTEWIFGASSQSCIAEIPESVREHYLPKGELQNIGSEKMDCASRSIMNLLETKFTFLVGLVGQ